MPLTSFVFMGFAAVVFCSLLLVQKFICSKELRQHIGKWILLVSSYFFLAYADVRFLLLLMLLTASSYMAVKKKKYGIGITIALAMLFFFKYFNFFAESFSRLFGKDFVLLNIILPLGISFYTFSAVSYIMDAKNGKTSSGSLLDVGVYLAFFPKLTSGPIQKSRDFFKQLNSDRRIEWSSIAEGIQIFVFGLFKKIVLADRLGVFVDQVYETPSVFGSMTVLLAAAAYSLQIYFDFSGYSDMAIGTARTVGFDLPRNFNLPYVSHNVTEFWKRWHITLSSCLQEYLYFPLGGSRKGTARTYENLLITMTCCGLWHGADWTFVFWGVLNGAALAVHKIWMGISGSSEKKHSAWSNAVSITVTFIFVTFSWIFFRAGSFSKAMTIITRIFSFKSGLEQPYLWLGFAAAALLTGTAAACFRNPSGQAVLKKMNFSRIDGFYPLLDLRKFWNLVVFFVFCGLILMFAQTGGNPFIYGNF